MDQKLTGAKVSKILLQKEKALADINFSNEVIHDKFSKKLTDIISPHWNKTNDGLSSLKFTLNNLWCFNQIIIPLVSFANAPINVGNLRVRYAQPDNDLNAYEKNKNNKFNSVETTQLMNELKEIQENESKTENTKIIHQNFSLDIENMYHDIVEKETDKQAKDNKMKIIQKNHIHTAFASNHLGEISVPLIVYPQNSEIEANMTDRIRKVISMEETLNGDFDNLQFFFNWLKVFIENINVENKETTDNEEKEPIVLLVNSFVYKLIFKSPNQLISTDLIRKGIVEFCKENHVYILFYPLQTTSDLFNTSIYQKFSSIWKENLIEYSATKNPHNQLGFFYIYKQVLRKLSSYGYQNTDNPMRAVFLELFQQYDLNIENFSIENITNNMEKLLKSAIDSGRIMTSNNLKKEFSSPKKSLSYSSPRKSLYDNKNPRPPSESYDECAEENSVTENKKIQIKFTDQDIEEAGAWLKEMSLAGSQCLKYTFLRELTLKYKKNKSGHKETLIKPFWWSDLISKIKIQINPNLYAVDSANYSTKWRDVNYWRMEYQNFIKKNEIKCSEAIWTFDIIQFPYNTTTNILKPPEKDYDRRPKNVKSRISVIFAFNAAGDYPQPYFIYPSNFVSSQTTENTETTSTDNESFDEKNETFSPHGFVTCRVLEKWLLNCFFPYLNELEEKKTKTNDKNSEELPLADEKTNLVKKDTKALLYCGNLAIVDTKNLQNFQTEKIQSFCFAHENQMPFTQLFQKVVRKNRQIDIFYDSWRKVVKQPIQSGQLKCKSRQEFFNKFMDTFQNCIEEIGNNANNVTAINSSVSNVSSIGTNEAKDKNTNQEAMDQSLNQSFSSVTDFKNKMISSFGQCELWPINEEKYNEYSSEALKMLETLEKSTDSKEELTSEDDVEMECDEESVSKNTLIQNKNIENKQGELKSSSTKKRLKASDEKTSESENLYSTMKNFNEEQISNWDISNADDTIEESDLENLDEIMDESQESQCSDSEYKPNKASNRRRSKKNKQDEQINEKKAPKLQNKIQDSTTVESAKKTKN